MAPTAATERRRLPWVMTRKRNGCAQGKVGGAVPPVVTLGDVPQGNGNAEARVGKRILIVDDSPAVRREVISALEGYDVVEACNGREGAEAIEGDDTLNLVICDVNMPEMGGLEMLERVNGAAANDNLSILMLTTEGQPSLIKRAKKLGAKGWIVKPFDRSHLVAAVRRLTA